MENYYTVQNKIPTNLKNNIEYNKHNFQDCINNLQAKIKDTDEVILI